MKKIITLILFTLLVAPVYAEFTDVEENYVYEDAIEYVERNNIVNGYSDETFRPTNTITRGEFTKIIINSIFGDNMTGSCTGTFAQEKDLFPDVQMGHTFFEYICLAKSSGIINGYSDGTYKVDNNITAAEASKIIAKAFELIDDSAIKIDEAHKFGPYVEALANVNAIPTTIVGLTQPLKRGEMAEMIFRIKTGDIQKPTQDYSILSNTEYSLTLYCGRTDFTTLYDGSEQWFKDTCIEPITTKCTELGGKFMSYANDKYRCIKMVK